MKTKLVACLGITAMTTTLMAATAPSASADATGVTFALAGGSLSVSAQPTAALGDKGGSGTTSVVGQLGNTVVTDNRGGVTGWSVGAATGSFTNGATTATGVSYSSGVATVTGLVVATSTGVTAMSATAAQVVVGTVVTGNNTATWNPTLTVTLPSSSTAGDYTGTITTSLL